MDEPPLDNSTPKHVQHVKGRPPIRDLESFQSPIENMESGEEESFSVDSDSLSESDFHDISKKKIKDISKKEQPCNWICIAIGIGCISIFCVLLYDVKEIEVEAEKYIMETLEKEFPNQMDGFWLSIEVVISEVKRNNRPKSVIFLYQDDTKHSLDRIVKGISSVAVCEITSCSSKPIIIEKGQLNTTDILEDYGEIIAENKEQLRENGVMIVKNLETVPGASAQAFHSLCDEVNPVIEKALFLFTMKVDKFYSNNIKAIENQLRTMWKDLKDDKFYPLFTRISDCVLPVNREK
ncbi:torsin interacting protein [Leptinotarsa decemlineata]|uniref:torsin interacting protein n=1 Tax=Leptinotarsa decemlineata TaxID=7539 RepID=UPI003D30727A